MIKHRDFQFGPDITETEIHYVGHGTCTRKKCNIQISQRDLLIFMPTFAILELNGVLDFVPTVTCFDGMRTNRIYICDAFL